MFEDWDVTGKIQQLGPFGLACPEMFAKDVMCLHQYMPPSIEHERLLKHRNVAVFFLLHRQIFNGVGLIYILIFCSMQSPKVIG